MKMILEKMRIHKYNHSNLKQELRNGVIVKLFDCYELPRIKALIGNLTINN